jgi:hypothetical protein
MPVAATGIQKQVIWPMDRCGDPKMRELAFTLNHVTLWPRRYIRLPHLNQTLLFGG